MFLPYNQPLEYVREFKQAHRRDDDIAIANAGMRVSFIKTSDGMVSSFRCAGQVAYLCLLLDVLDYGVFEAETIKQVSH